MKNSLSLFHTFSFYISILIGVCGHLPSIKGASSSNSQQSTPMLTPTSTFSSTFSSTPTSTPTSTPPMSNTSSIDILYLSPEQEEIEKEKIEIAISLKSPTTKGDEVTPHSAIEINPEGIDKTKIVLKIKPKKEIYSDVNEIDKIDEGSGDYKEMVNKKDRLLTVSIAQGLLITVLLIPVCMSSKKKARDSKEIKDQNEKSEVAYQQS